MGTMNTKTLLALFVLASFAFATNIDNANYTGSMNVWQFVTDMQFTTTFSASSGGQPLASGDTVTSGSTIEITPSISATWANPDLSIVSIYPLCSGSGCPQMINHTGSVNTNRPVVWLSTATFNTHKSYGDANDWSKNETRAAQLEPFATEPMTYTTGPGKSYPNKEGGANIYCKGTVEVLDGTTVVGSAALPASGPVSFTLSGAGSHPLAVQLKGVACFAAVEKHPLDKGTQWFYFYYFTRPSPTTVIPATMAVSATIPVVVSSCNITHTAYTTTGSVDEDYFMLITPITNSGAISQVKSVTTTNSDYTVEPFQVSLCATLGFPSSLCPTSNGFNVDIPTGSARDTYVLVTRGANPDPTQTLPITYTAQTSSESCTDVLSLGNPDCPVIVCSVDPSAFTMRTQDVLNATVTCENLAGQSIPCIDANWSWSNGLAGDFITKTEAFAEAYSTSPPSSRGLLNYNSCSAWCFSEISLTPDPPRCTFDPTSATLAIDGSQNFSLICEDPIGTVVTPTNAIYDLINGLGGNTSGESVSGVTYNAPSISSSGDLLGFATLPTDVPPIIGAVAIAPIDVIVPDITSCEVTPAVVAPPDINLSQNMGMEWTVVCRNAANAVVPCSGEEWRWENGLSGPVPGDHPSASSSNVITHSTSAPGSSGQLTYYTIGANCSSNVTLLDHLDGWCTFSPPSASMGYTQSRYFTLNCMNNISGTPVPFTPDSAVYNRVAGLLGETSNSSVNGTTYTSPAINNSGVLEGLGYTNLFAPALYLAANASIRVGIGGGNDIGDNEWCTINGLGVRSITVNPGKSYWVQIKCGPNHNETCAVGDVQWSVDPNGLMSYTGNNLGLGFTITRSTPIDTHLTLYATILSQNHGCSKELYVDKDNCLTES